MPREIEGLKLHTKIKDIIWSTYILYIIICNMYAYILAHIYFLTTISRVSLADEHLEGNLQIAVSNIEPDIDRLIKNQAVSRLLL